VVVAELLLVVGPIEPNTSKNSATTYSNGKPEAAAAVDKLLMMGMTMP
jgi:hypothetical protein